MNKQLFIRTIYAGILSICVSYYSVNAQTASFISIDSFANNLPYASLPIIAQKINTHTKDPLKRARAIYIWITQHIAYDVAASKKTRHYYFTYKNTADSIAWHKKFDEKQIQNVIQNKVAVCDGYARVFKTLCEACNIPCIIINGKARTIDYNYVENNLINHSWNAIEINNKWQLVDATWGSGYVDNNMFVKSLSNFYFCTSPQYLVYTHLPDMPIWQLVDTPISKLKFQEMPIVSSVYFDSMLKDFSPNNNYLEGMQNNIFSFGLSTAHDKSLLKIYAHTKDARGKIQIKNIVYNYADYTYNEEPGTYRKLSEQILLPKNTVALDIDYNLQTIIRYPVGQQ